MTLTRFPKMGKEMSSAQTSPSMNIQWNCFHILWRGDPWPHRVYCPPSWKWTFISHANESCSFAVLCLILKFSYQRQETGSSHPLMPWSSSPITLYNKLQFSVVLFSGAHSLDMFWQVLLESLRWHHPAERINLTVLRLGSKSLLPVSFCHHSVQILLC